MLFRSKSIATPDGQVVFDSCLEYSVSENGEYEFIVEDLSGNIETLSVNVDNLDNSLPEGSVDIVALDDGNVCAFIEAWDEDSGISNIILPGNLMVNGDSSNVILDREKKYEVIITDNAGNTNKITFTVEGIEEVPEDSDDSDNNSNNNGMISGDNNLNSSDNSSNTNNGSNNSNLNSSDNNSSNNITDTHIESNESENSDSIANTDTDAENNASLDFNNKDNSPLFDSYESNDDSVKGIGIVAAVIFSIVLILLILALIVLIKSLISEDDNALDALDDFDNI